MEAKPIFESTGDWDEIVGKLVDGHNMAVEGLTRFQFCDVLKQMIASGDFMRVVRAGPPEDQAVVYLPYRRVQELEARIRELEAEIERLKEGQCPSP